MYKLNLEQSVSFEDVFFIWESFKKIKMMELNIASKKSESKD
jgi:hypothetical protein